MKPGDTLICKVTNSGILKYGKSYKIIDVINKHVSVDIGPSYVTFNLEKHYFDLFVYDMFYTKEELRLLKLDSL